MRLRQTIFLTAALAAASIPATALEKTAHVDYRDANRGLEQRLEASTAALTAAFNNLHDEFDAFQQHVATCAAKTALYAPASASADADGCVSLAGTPMGAVVAFSAAACPSGWAQLNAANGRMIVGTGNSGDGGDPYRATYALGNTGGETRHTLTIAEMPAHTHDYIDDFVNYWRRAKSDNDDRLEPQQASHWRTTNPAGGNGAHENRPPYLALLYCYKQ